MEAQQRLFLNSTVDSFLVDPFQRLKEYNLIIHLFNQYSQFFALIWGGGGGGILQQCRKGIPLELPENSLFVFITKTHFHFFILNFALDSVDDCWSFEK